MPTNNTSSPPSFESAIAELETLVSQMESISAFKRGAELLQFCQKSLADAEQQVRILTETNQLADFETKNE
jgi:exodeoxyribonuclease VII small subunit